jgi:hypothetical protein
VAKAFLEHDQIHQFHDLLTMIQEKDERFYWWNDVYFLTRCQEVRFNRLIRDPRVEDLNEMLLFRKPPKTLHHPLFEHKLLKADGTEKKKLIGQIQDKIAEFERAIKKHGTGKEWILADIPERDIVFTRALPYVVKKRKSDNLYREPEPVKVIARDGTPSLLVERENILMSHLSSFINFVPSVYGNAAAAELLKARKLIAE